MMKSQKNHSKSKIWERENKKSNTSKPEKRIPMVASGGKDTDMDVPKSIVL